MIRLRQYKRSIAFWILAGYAVLLFVVAILSEGTYGGADSILHFQMARYAPLHTELFLDQWGKPLFTFITCLPSQLGFIGIKLFNTGCALLTAAIAYKIAQNQFRDKPWVVIVFVMSVPIYFVTIFSGLTEPLFALCIMASIGLMHRYREQWACLIISFLPFIRSEGFLILPLFAVFCIYYRKWKALPLLGTGVVVFTFVGYFMQHSWNWVFGTNIYLTQPTNYGHGNLFHFVLHHREITGWAGTFFMLASIVAFASGFRRNYRNRELHIQVVLIFGSFFIYFLAHSIFWYKGIFSSAGLTRVMAGVGPCMGYCMCCGWQYIWHHQYIQRHRIARILILVLSGWMFIMPRYVYAFPFDFSEFQKMQKEACAYLVSEGLGSKFLYYEEPFIPVLLNRDPFDRTQSESLYHYGDKPFRPDAIILWDSHLCPVEGMLPDSIISKQNVRLLKRYSAPDEYDPTTTMEVRIYQSY